MLKKIIITCLSTFILCANLIVVEANTDANYVYAMDLETKLPLYQKNHNDMMYPASLTKIVTTLVAIDLIEDLDDTVTITKDDFVGIYEVGGSTAGFAIGQEVTYLDLLYGTILPSGAEACLALANNLTSGIDEFVGLMNDYFNDLGLKNTNFKNNTGFHHDDHYTTAYEMSLIIEDAIQNELFLKIFTTYNYTTSDYSISWKNGAMAATLSNNYSLDNIVGCKSGYTYKSQFCLGSLLNIDGRSVIMVTGQTDSSISTVSSYATMQVIDSIVNEFENINLFEDTKVIDYYDVKSYNNEKLKVFIDDVSLYLPHGTTLEDIELTYSFDKIDYQISKGDVLGEMYISYQGNVLYTQDVISYQDIYTTFINKAIRTPYIIIPFISIGGIIVFIVYKKKK